MEGDYRLTAIRRHKPKNELNYFFNLSSTHVEGTGQSDTHHMINPTHDDDIPPEDFNDNLLWLLIIPALAICGFFSCSIYGTWRYCNKKNKKENIKYNTDISARERDLINDYNLRQKINFNDDENYSSSSDSEYIPNNILGNKEWTRNTKELYHQHLKKSRIISSTSDEDLLQDNNNEYDQIEVAAKNAGPHIPVDMHQTLNKRRHKTTYYDDHIPSETKMIIDLYKESTKKEKKNYPKKKKIDMSISDDEDQKSKPAKKKSQKRSRKSYQVMSKRMMT